MLSRLMERMAFRPNENIGNGPDDGDKGGSSSGGGTGEEGGGDGRRPSRSKRSNDRDALVMHVIDKHGNANRAVRELAWEVVNIREENARLRRWRRFERGQATLDDIRKLPFPQGATVISAEEKAELEAYRKIGKPTDLAKVATEHGEMSSRIQEQDRQRIWGEAATAAKFNAKALLDLAPKDLTMEMRETVVKKDDGESEKVRLPYVRKDANSPWESLEDYAKREWEVHLPSLRVEEAGGAPAGGGSNGSGLRFPQQHSTQGSNGSSGAKKKPSEIADAAMARMYPGPKVGAASDEKKK